MIIAREYVRSVMDRASTLKTQFWHEDLETAIYAEGKEEPRRQWINQKRPNPRLYLDPRKIKKIGSTGYNFRTGCAEWVGIDIDGSSHGSGCTEEEIAMLTSQLSKVSFLRLFTSTSGDGLHCIVPLKNPVPVPKKRGLHGLGKQAVEIIDSHLDLPKPFPQYVDVKGGNLWLIRFA